MKKNILQQMLLGLIIIALVAISSQCFSQNWMKNTPGQELQKAAGQFTVGAVFIGVGTALAVANLPTANRPGDSLFRTAGSVFALAGAVICMTSWSHIKRAGILLDKEKKVTAYIGPGSVTLTLHL